MHAWSEVEHDLVYKPLEDSLSEDEYAILDELNGLVMAGEIALERLQKAAERRVAAADRKFENQYDLAAHIASQIANMLPGPLGDSALGRVDLLLELLNKLDLATPDKLEPYIQSLSMDTERRPIAEQIIDRLLAEDESRYQVYESIRSTRQATPAYKSADDTFMELEVHNAMGFFLTQWTSLERLVKQLAKKPPTAGRQVFTFGAALQDLTFIPPNTRQEIERIRRLRNDLVHGIFIPSAADLRDAGERLHQMAIEIEQRAADLRAP